MNQISGAKKRGSVTLQIGLFERVDRIVKSRRFGFDSRADAVADALNRWLPEYEARLERVDEWFEQEKKKLLAED